MRVLHLIDNLRMGGAQTLIYDLAVSNPFSDVAIEVAALVGSDDLSPRFRDIGVPVHILARSKFDPRFLLRLRQLLRPGRFDLVHVHLLVSNFIMSRFHGLLGAPVFVDHLHNMATEIPPGMEYQRALEKLAFSKSRAIVSCARTVGNSFRAFRPQWAERVVDLPNGVHIAALREKRIARAALRREYGLAETDVVIGTAGRLVPQKNHPLLLRAFAELGDRLPGASLVIMGQGPDEAALRGLAVALGIADRVRFLGYVADAPARFPLFDVFVLPSNIEGLGLVLAEAMVQEVAVVATDFAPARELIEPGRTGLVTPLGDVHALAEAIATLATDPEMRARFIPAARAKIEAEFSIDGYWQKLRRVYDNATRGIHV